MAAKTIPDLTDNQRWALAELVVLFTSGWTGTVTIRVNEGGVSSFKDERSRTPPKESEA